MSERLTKIPPELLDNLGGLNDSQLPVVLLRFADNSTKFAFVAIGENGVDLHCQITDAEDDPLVVKNVALPDLTSGIIPTPVKIDGERQTIRIKYLGQLGDDPFVEKKWAD